MNNAIKTRFVLLLTTVLMAACSSTPEPQHDPYNPADSQRSRAQQAQDELSTETSGEK
jgi:outer membrane biogenesis lipoprotein LolB